MKPTLTRISAIVLLLGMLLMLSACGSKKEDTLSEYLEKNGITQQQLDESIAAAKATPVPTAEPTPTPVPTVMPTATPVPTVAPTPVPTPVPTAVPTPTAAPLYPTITKNPTSESLTEGGNAIFVAYADNYQFITWRLVSSDGSRVIYMNEAPYSFSGLSVIGDGTSRLTLCNCPTSLSGWTVEAIFSGNGMQAITSRAYITVSPAPKVQLYASPSSGYFQYCDETVYIYGGYSDQYYYELYRDGGYGNTLYSCGTKNCGEPVFLGCENGVTYTYYLYAYVIGDSSNAISCSYVMDGKQSVVETVYAMEGYDNAGFASRQVTQSGWYYFTSQTYSTESFDIYILDSYFQDADRYIPQAYNSSMTLYASNSGGLYLNAGQYVYICCSANSLTGETPSSSSYVQWSME